MSYELFAPDRYSTPEKRAPIRPLAAFSTLVIDKIPYYGGNFADSAELLARNLLRDNNVQRLVGGSAKLTKLARVDVQMAYNFIVNHPDGSQVNNNQPGEALTKLAADMADLTGRPMTTTYEDYIEDNDKNDTRVYAGGAVAVSEQGFIRAHQIIEHHLEIAVDRMFEAVDILSGPSIDTKALLLGLTEALEHTKPLVSYMHTLKDHMPTEHFLDFRRFLKSVPDPRDPSRSLPGASGQQTFRVPVTDLLLGGDRITDPEYFTDMEKLYPFMPIAGRPQLQAAMRLASEGKTIRTLLKKHPENKQISKLVENLAVLKKTFRDMHYRGVQRQMPYEEGTGGTDPKVYLSSMIERTRNI